MNWFHFWVVLGFQSRIKGSHHIFYRENIVEIINIQEMSGKAKPYQVKQVRSIILKYKIELREADKIKCNFSFV